MTRPRLLYKLTPEMEEAVKTIHEQADPGMIGEMENGHAMAKSMTALTFTRYDRPKYWAEIGTKGPDLVYHFFPLEGQNFPDNFVEKMGDAFHEIFAIPEKIEAAPSQELNSWAVRVRGGAHPLLDPAVPIVVLDMLDQKL